MLATRATIACCAAAGERLRLEIVKRPRDAEGFHLLPRRWVIERTFAWLGRNRRLAKDFERLIDTSTAMAVVASHPAAHAQAGKPLISNQNFSDGLTPANALERCFKLTICWS